jgi:hypothetical protein
MILNISKIPIHHEILEKIPTTILRKKQKMTTKPEEKPRKKFKARRIQLEKKGFSFEDPFPDPKREEWIDGAFYFLSSEEGLRYLAGLWWGQQWEKLNHRRLCSRSRYIDLVALMSCRSYSIWSQFASSYMWLSKRCPIYELLKSKDLSTVKGPFPGWVIPCSDSKLFESLAERCVWRHKAEWWVMFGKDGGKSQREEDDPENNDTPKIVFQRIKEKWKVCKYHEISGCGACTFWYPAPGGTTSCALCELMVDKKLWRGDNKGWTNFNWCGRWDCSGQK